MLYWLPQFWGLNWGLAPLALTAPFIQFNHAVVLLLTQLTQHYTHTHTPTPLHSLVPPHFFLGAIAATLSRPATRSMYA